MSDNPFACVICKGELDVIEEGYHCHKCGRDYRKNPAGIIDFCYDEGRQGGRLRLGYPLGEFTRGSLAYKFEDVEISDVDDDASSHIKREEGSFTTSSLRLGLVKDTRDNTLEPTTGYENSVSAEVVFLSIGGLAHLDQEYKETLFSEVVASTGASRLFPLHYDDFTR